MSGQRSPYGKMNRRRRKAEKMSARRAWQEFGRTMIRAFRENWRASVVTNTAGQFVHTVDGIIIE